MTVALLVIFIYILFSYSFFVFLWGGGVLGGLTAHQDYFTHFQPSQSLGGAKKGDLREKQPDHPQAQLVLSHMWPKLGSNLQRWDDKRFRALKISSLNHSATCAAWSHILATPILITKVVVRKCQAKIHFHLPHLHSSYQILCNLFCSGH